MQHPSILRTCRNWWPSSRGVCDKCGYGARFCWAEPCRKADSGSAPSARRGGGESAGGGCCAPWSPRRTAGRRKSRSATPAPYGRSDSPPPRLCTALKENGMQQVRQEMDLRILCHRMPIPNLAPARKAKTWRDFAVKEIVVFINFLTS